MNTDLLRGICVGAAAGAAVEFLMASHHRCTKTRAGDTMRAMGNAVDDMVGNISHTMGR